MKLIYCKECGDVLSLDYHKKSCKCERSSGYYKDDGLNAIYSGEAIPLGIDNIDFHYAILNQPPKGKGFKYDSFVIPKECPTFKKV